MRKPRTAAGYVPEFTGHVKATCFYIATKIGDLVDDTVIVGGLVPSLIIDDLSSEPHVGTVDLDVGLAVAVFDHQRYEVLAERLRQAGFGPDTNEAGKPTRQRWQIDGPPKVTVDFLIPPSRDRDKGGAIRNIENDFAAIIAPGLKLAFIDQRTIKLDGRTIRNERAAREIQVCGPAAFVAMKALAFRSRGENKDAYDLWFVLRHFGVSMLEVVDKMRPMLREPAVIEALGYLREDFSDIDSVGPKRVAEFLGRDGDDELQADVRGLILDFVKACGIRTT